MSALHLVGSRRCSTPLIWLQQVLQQLLLQINSLLAFGMAQEHAA
jgi:hypothetical protein